MPLDQCAQLLRQAIGMDIAAVGQGVLGRALRVRMQATSLDCENDYLQVLQASQDELEALIEEIVVPETWFFRETAAFKGLRSFVAQHPGRPIRGLSIPCCTGEEPYSMAIALLEAGVPLASFHIDAIDVSRQALARAEQGVYGKRSFRGDDQAFRDRYFVRKGAEYELDPAVRAAVHFRHGNITEPRLLAGEAPYDLILCRNLLIYLTEEYRRHSLATCARLLRPDGLLFTGASEPVSLLTSQFTPMPRPYRCAYKKVASPLKALHAVPSPLKGRARVGRHKDSESMRKIDLPPHLNPPLLRGGDFVEVRKKLIPIGPEPVPETIESVRALADQGKLAEAARACELWLETHPSSAEAQSLLGVIRQASGDQAGAEACFRRALYLDPRQPEALTHLGRLLERRGDREAAHVQRRARQAKEENV